MLLRGQSHNQLERWNRLGASAAFAALPVLALIFIGYVLHAGFGTNLPLVEAATGINKMMSYQAKMTDSAGVTVPNGTYWLTIRIYDSASGGACSYTASGTSCGAATSTPVTVTNGLFSILIGDTTSQNALTLDFNSDTYYLGVQVGNDSEMTPRKRIGAAGYAINSDTLDGYNTSSNGGSGAYVPVTTAVGDFFITNRIMSSSTIYISGAGTSTFSYGTTMATAGGNIGVGTSTPAAKLHVYNGTLLVNGFTSSTLTGSIDTPEYALNVYTSGKYAYVSDYSSLQIIDVANPASPVVVGTLATADYTYDVKTVGNYAYIADYRKVSVVDISKPTAPKVVGTYTPPVHALGIAVSGKYAYVADDTQGLDILDIANPASPTRVGFYSTSTNMRNVDILGNYAYVAEGNSGMEIIDISNPTSPKPVAEVSTGNFTYRAYVSGRYAYLADGSAGMKIVDIANPASPVTTSTFSVGTVVRNIQVAGNYAYLAGTNGVYVVDVSNPASPALLGSYATPAIAYGIHVVGKYAYVATYTSGLYIVDLKGADISTARIGNLETGAMTVNENLDIGRDLYIRNGLGVGPGGIFSQGAFAMSVSSTGSGADIFNISASGTTALPYLTVKENGYFGVGTSTPVTTLTVDGSVLFSGNSGGTPASGAGTRMMWIPSKAAFRAGTTNAYLYVPEDPGFSTDMGSPDVWDDQFVGNYSVAFGLGSKASGAASFAAGVSSTASGSASYAVGNGANANNLGTVAIGTVMTASGTFAAAIGGMFGTASGTESMVLGNNANAYGNASVAIGGSWDFCMGGCMLGPGFHPIYANGDRSAVLGFDLQANGNSSFIIGTGNEQSTPLVNSTANSLAVGFNSTVPTLIVSGGSGAGTFGTVSIASSTYNANAALNVDGSVLFSGNSGGTPVSGPGTRMMWIPSKYAFRAGAVDPTVTAGYGIPTAGTEWDAANIGDYSIALGLSNKASGIGSTAIGVANIASGLGANAFGASTTANGTASISLGYNTLSSGFGSLAIGNGTIASADESLAGGFYSAVWGSAGGVALGWRANATSTGVNYVGISLGYNTAAINGTALGYYSSATAEASNAIGYYATASGNQSTAIGNYANASANWGSFAMGNYVTASGVNSFAVGTYASSTADWATVIGRGVSLDEPLVNSTANSLAVGFNSTVPTLMVTGGSGAGTFGTVSIASSTYNANAALNVDGSVLFSGNSGATPVSGPGTRLMWIPSKYAFRAGAVDPTVTAGYGIPTAGTEWDDAYIGDYSIALGLSDRASGLGSTAIGAANVASGVGATALGVTSTASGDYSTAMGLDTTASGGWSTAMGGTTVASGAGSVAMGTLTTASGDESFAMGYQATAKGYGAVSMGWQTSASSTGTADNTAVALGYHTTAIDNGTALGYYTMAMSSGAAIGDHTFAGSGGAIAIGTSSTASGIGSIAAGWDPFASGDYGSVALGFGTAASGQYGATAIGSSITVSGDSSVGIGLGFSGAALSSANTMAIMGGNVGIGTVTPSEKLTVSGNIALGDGTTTSTLGFATSTYIYAHPLSDAAGYSAFTINTTSTISNADIFTIRSNGTRVFGINATTSTFPYGATFATSGGNIGIGSTAPMDKFYVEGSAVFKGPRPYIDVRAYGAKGDGSTDDLAAINAAIAAIPSGGAQLYFPAGTYNISSDLTAITTANVKVIGAGKGTTIIHRTTAPSSGSLYGIFTVQVGQFEISDLTLQGSSSFGGTVNLRGKGIYGNVAPDLYVHDIEAKNMDGEAIYTDGDSPRTRFEKNYIHDCATNTLNINSASTVSAYSWITDNVTNNNSGGINVGAQSIIVARNHITNPNFTGTDHIAVEAASFSVNDNVIEYVDSNTNPSPLIHVINMTGSFYMSGLIRGNIVKNNETGTNDTSAPIFIDNIEQGDIVVENNVISGNGTATGHNSPAIGVAGANMTAHVLIQNNYIRKGSVNNQNKGIRIESTVPVNNNITIGPNFIDSDVAEPYVFAVQPSKIINTYTATGNFGIGTSGPTDLLTISTSATSSLSSINITIGDGSTTSTLGFATSTYLWGHPVSDTAGYSAFTINTTSTLSNASLLLIRNNGTSAFAIGGDYSIRGGYNNASGGKFSSAFGYGTTASGSGSFASGDGSVASGATSTALGHYTTASGQSAFAMGHYTYATGAGSMAFGDLVTASGVSSTAFGGFASSTATGAIVIGAGADATNPLINSISSSLMIGFRSTVPTLFVGPSSGAGTTGNVGIGSSAPSEKLTVVGSGAFGNNSSTTTISGSSTSTFPYGATFAGNGVNLLSNGRVGIATENPAYILDVSGEIRSNAAIYTPTISNAGNGGTLYITTLDKMEFGNGGYFLQNTPNSFDIAIFTGTTPTQRMTWSENGYIGIGNTSPTTKLTVSGGDLMVGSNAATSTMSGNTLAIGAQTGYNLGKFYVDSSGNVNASGSINFPYGFTEPLKVGNGSSTTTISGSATSTFPYGMTFATSGGSVLVATTTDPLAATLGDSYKSKMLVDASASGIGLTIMGGNSANAFDFLVANQALTKTFQLSTNENNSSTMIQIDDRITKTLTSGGSNTGLVAAVYLRNAKNNGFNYDVYGQTIQVDSDDESQVNNLTSLQVKAQINDGSSASTTIGVDVQVNTESSATSTALITYGIRSQVTQGGSVAGTTSYGISATGGGSTAGMVTSYGGYFQGGTATTSIGIYTTAGGGGVYNYALQTSGNIKADALPGTASGDVNVCISTGNLITYGTPCGGSTRAIKYNIENLASGLEVVSKMQPVTFNYIANDVADIGFIAEDMEALDPRIAAYNSEGQLYNWKEREVLPYIVKALQEQQSEIRALSDIPAPIRGSERLEAGDVVVIDTSTSTTRNLYDGRNINDVVVKKSGTPYAGQVVGVVSAESVASSGDAVMMNGETAFAGADVPVAIVGRAPVKVTDENGPILPGDYLVSSSSTPGAAMRFNPTLLPFERGGAEGLPSIIGMALLKFAPDEGANGEGEVTNIACVDGKENFCPADADGHPRAFHLGKVLTLVQGRLPSIFGALSAGESLNLTTSADNRMIANTDIDMTGKKIIGIGSIVGAEDKWGVTEDGLFYAKVQTSSGEKKVYATASENPEITLSGSSKLINGTARIDFDPAYREIIDSSVLMKVFVTLTSNEAMGIYVGNKDGNGFTAQETAGGTSSATFDWYVVAKRRTTADGLQTTAATQISPPASSQSEPAQDARAGGGGSTTTVTAATAETPTSPTSTPETPTSTPELPPIETPTTTPVNL